MLLDKDVTDVYIIYGFEKSVQYEGAPSDIYEFYDDFSYTELPEDVWTFSSPDSQSSYILDGNTIRLRDYYNNGSRLTTTASFSVYNRIDIRWRRNVWSGDYGDMDSSYGLNGGVIIPIGGTDTSTEAKHSIKYADNDLAVGTEDIKSTFLTATSWVDDGYQKSIYNGEVLTASATIPESTGTLFIVVGNSSNAPDIEVDWVKVSKFSALEPNYTEHPAVLISESDFVARLYAIYSDSSSYIYTSGLDEIIQASHINDIYVTEGTSQYGNGNVLFLATDLGAVVIEERRGDEINSRFKYYRLDT
jgi:hypothetical protein